MVMTSSSAAITIIIVINCHTVTAGLSGESTITIGPITCLCFGSASDAFVAAPRFVAPVLCRLERLVWQLKQI
jgi:hypothetical protein